MTWTELTDEQLKQLAIDIHAGNVYTDMHIQDMSDLPSVFTPIILGAFNGETKESLKELGMVYEYLDKAGPRSINGLPSFFSMKVLSIEQANKVKAFHDEQISIHVRDRLFNQQ